LKINVLCVVAILFLSSCIHDESQQNEINETEEIWVCYNPKSERHGKPCKKDFNPSLGEYETCHWSMSGSSLALDESAFCWLLERRDCSPQADSDLGWQEWQEKHCPLFSE